MSISTVSRALQNHPAIKKETIELVKKQAADFEYFPDGVARSLRNKSTNTIGVSVEGVEFGMYICCSIRHRHLAEPYYDNDNL
ncbi:MAG: LacI family DNA-binding transcriptional regulator [Bacteroidetes bacterium]|nr:LacI family DNA-binding transcriptional regulator [Bacteroidota bacterium]